MSARARQARFDGASQHRRGLIAKVHVARKQLGLDEDSYRQILADVTGHASAGDCDERQLKAVLGHFESRGFAPRPRKAGVRPAADHPSARKARALWISLHQLGAIDNPAEQALEAFARRQLKVSALQWADQSQCYKLIEALKAVAERHGWRQDFTGPLAALDSMSRTRQLKARLCEAILVKLKAADIVPGDWTLADAAFRLCGITLGEGRRLTASVEELDLCARSLGDKLRGAKP